MTKPTVESLEAALAEASRRIDELTTKLERVSPTPVRPKNEDVETYLKVALTRMEGDPAKAAGLFYAWTQQNSEVRDSLQPLIQDYIESRLVALQAEVPEVA